MPKHHPTPEEREERYTLPLDPEEAIPAILATGPHSDDEETVDADAGDSAPEAPVRKS